MAQYGQSVATHVVVASMSLIGWHRCIDSSIAVSLTVVSATGVTLWTRDSVAWPEVLDEEFPLRLLVHPEVPPSSHLPDVLHIETTGLGGRDLGFPERWNISLRSDKEGQNVYGPSLATVETTVHEPNGRGGTTTYHVTALGLSEATHEFLTLHYFALDSASTWDKVLSELLPQAQFPGAVVRRAVAFKVFQSCHIAPSHRRFPHVLWMDALSLVTDLLMGCGVGRYLGSLEGPPFEQEVALRGFSAGSFAGLALLQILWTVPGVVTSSRLGAIACPPGLLMMAPLGTAHELHLIHYI